MNQVYLLIGGNLGVRQKNLAKARAFIEDELGNILLASSIYETASWGITDQPHFLNQALFVKTNFTAEKTLATILFIENKMGRKRTQKNASRIIDIDILFFNNEIIRMENLVIPHPEIQNRKFALTPMNEIAADFVHPVFKQSIQNLLSTITDTLEVKLLTKV